MTRGLTGLLVVGATCLSGVIHDLEFVPDPGPGSLGLGPVPAASRRVWSP